MHKTVPIDQPPGTIVLLADGTIPCSINIFERIFIAEY
jgi:hypothetical protein